MLEWWKGCVAELVKASRLVTEDDGRGTLMPMSLFVRSMATLLSMSSLRRFGEGPSSNLRSFMLRVGSREAETVAEEPLICVSNRIAVLSLAEGGLTASSLRRSCPCKYESWARSCSFSS